MASIAQAKTLGGVGSILIILTIVPMAGPFLGIIGFILVLIAVKYLSDELNDRSIFNNMIIAVVLGIVGVAVATLVAFASFSGMVVGEAMSQAQLGSIIATGLAVLVIVWIAMIASAIFLRKSFNALASGLNIRLFGTAALLYLIGAILVIALGIGLIIILVAEILQTVAFFSLSEAKIPAPPPSPAPAT